MRRSTDSVSSIEMSIRLAIDGGINFMLRLDVSMLADSGIPEHVLNDDEWQGGLVLRFDVGDHSDHCITFNGDVMAVSLSFDTLYSCRVPLRAILNIVMAFDPPPESPIPASGLKLV
ncbi:hypothetical protein LCGC14_2343290 [marine sediment metagenome]|uniref:Uncharacterized protein n=1 Tax=marine sediment metagenome TaxID=412755 RepID=A0A0F9CYY9_9ZZZZ